MDKRECLKYLNSSGFDIEIHKRALIQKEAVYGQEIFLRGIIEFSNFCRKNCLYCGIRKDNRSLKRYRMSIEDIILRAELIVSNGIKTIVLQSGEDTFYSRDLMCKIIAKIRKKYDVAITLCIGEREPDDYKAFYDAGASRFLMKHETSNDEVYEKLHPGETLKERLKLIEILKKIGFQVGSGNIVGLPFTSTSDYVNDIFLIKSLDLDMAGIGPFMPTENTPLKNFTTPSVITVIKLLALARIVLKDVNIPATTALFSLGGTDALEMAIDSGANVIMPNFTGDDFRKNYRIYDNKTPLDMTIISKLIEKKRIVISKSKGERRKNHVGNNEIREKKGDVCWAN